MLIEILDMKRCKSCLSYNIDKPGFYCNDCGIRQVGCFRKVDAMCNCDRCLNDVEQAIDDSREEALTN